MANKKNPGLAKAQLVDLELLHFPDDGHYGIGVDGEFNVFASKSGAVVKGMIAFLNKKFEAVYELGYAHGKQAGEAEHG